MRILHAVKNFFTKAFFGVFYAYQAAVLDIAVGYTGWLPHPGQIVAEIRDDTDPTWASGCVTQCTEVYSGTTVNDGNFHHVAVVRDAVERQVKIYIDGVLTSQANDNLKSSGRRSSISLN